MADFLVLEEDGTSHLELEGSSDDLLTEESGTDPLAKSGHGVVGTKGSGVGPPAPVPSNATWKVGTITVPSSPGSIAVTGLGGTPAAVFFFGTNWLTEDTAVTSTGCGLFRGMAAPKWDAPGTILQNVAFISPPGDQHILQDNAAFWAFTTAGTGTTLYAGGLASLDVDGFTVSVSTAAAGGYKIVYAALMDVQNVGSYVGNSTTLTPGWKAGASLLHGAWGGTSISGTDRTQEFYGSAGYPGTSSSGWTSAGLAAYCFPTSAFGQYNMELDNLGPTVKIASDGNFSGPFLAPQNVTAYPSGGGLTNFAFSTNLSDNYGMVTLWDDEDSQTGRNTPATSTSGTTTVTGLPFAPGLIITYTISDEPSGLGSSSGGGQPGRGAAGMSVVTSDFQWCATIDGTLSRGSFQSFQRGFADVVNGTNVHAGTVALTTDGFVMTTEEDDVGPENIVWHAFGHPKVLGWIPQSYRRRNRP